MDPNTYSTGQPDRLGPLEAAKQTLAAEDLERLSEVAWPRTPPGCASTWTAWKASGSRRLVAVDARGAAGAELDQPACPRPAGCGAACA